MTEKRTKSRQGQRGCTPKPLCEKCGEILRRVYTRELVDGKQRYIPGWWRCPSATCDYIVKEFVCVDLEEGQEE